MVLKKRNLLYLGQPWNLIIVLLLCFVNTIYTLPISEYAFDTTSSVSLPIQEQTYNEHNIDINKPTQRVDDQSDSDRGNPVFNEIFDNVSNNYISYNSFLKTATAKLILDERIKVLGFYQDPTTYALASAIFDNFLYDFIPDNTSFYRYAFSVLDLILLPGLGVDSYSASELSRLRTETIQEIPNFATDSQRKDFIAVLDSIFSSFPNGTNLGNLSE